MPNRTLILAAALLIGGCDFVDYYPQHAPPEQTSDLQKQGAGSYGGANSNFPIGTPGTVGVKLPAGGPPTTMPS